MGDELGYYEPQPGIYGTANPATDSDPFKRAALQEEIARQEREIAERLTHLLLAPR